MKIDDAHLGGERAGEPGQRGRGSPNKIPFVMAVSTTVDRKPHQLVIRCMPFTSKAVLDEASGQNAERHQPLLLNWFRAKKQFPSGIVEGFCHRQSEIDDQKSLGFRTYHAAEIALYHVLGALPVPKTTHEFFRRG